jgi:hypothetical protein
LGFCHCLDYWLSSFQVIKWSKNGIKKIRKRMGSAHPYFIS